MIFCKNLFCYNVFCSIWGLKNLAVLIQNLQKYKLGIHHRDIKNTTVKTIALKANSFLLRKLKRRDNS